MREIYPSNKKLGMSPSFLRVCPRFIQKLLTLLKRPLSKKWGSVTVWIALSTCFIHPNVAIAQEILSPWALQFGVGKGSHTARKIDIALVFDPKLSWWDNGAWHFSVVGEAHLAQWRILHSKNVMEAGLTPVFLYAKNTGSIRPYIEAGVGIRLLSRAHMTDDYTLSTHFQFADMLGVGATFGQAMRYKGGVRFQHLSNAGIKKPNPGINFTEAFIQYSF